MPPKLHNLQALRAVACLLVVLFHVSEWELRTGLNPEYHLLYPFQFFGYAGVDLFFAISGFIITWVHDEKLGRPGALRDYAFKRAWRIYPVYWFCWVASVLLLCPLLRIGVPAPGWRETVSCLVLWPQRSTGLAFQTWNYYLPQSWSLVYEVMFYLVFAGFFLVPRRWFPRLLAVWFVATAAVAVAGVRPGRAGLPVQPLVLEFLLGCFVALALRRWRPVAAEAFLMLGVLGFAAGAWLGSADTLQDARQRALLFGVPSALLVYGLTALEMRGGLVLPRWLRSVGDASYSIYLTHLSAFFVVRALTPGLSHSLVPHLGWVALMIGAALAAGFLCYRGVERPLLQLARRRRPPHAGVVAERRTAA